MSKRKDPRSSPGLRTDLYQLTMTLSFLKNGFTPLASFEYFIREYPPNRSYFLLSGLSGLLDFLKSLDFKEEEVDYLRSLPQFQDAPRSFFDFLLNFSFSGDVWSIPEGEVVFAGEPLLTVRAPIMEAQIIESYLLNTMNFQTMIATKASRIFRAGRGKKMFDFGLRRAHGGEASLLAARASYIGGFTGTSNVEAGFLLGIPVFGTVAHSYIMAYGDEEEAFRSLQRGMGGDALLLLDTFDTMKALGKAIKTGVKWRGVRLDSGDLLNLSREVRRALDETGLQETLIAVSGDLNEYIIEELLDEGAPIDLFGVGTQLVTSYDAPALGGIYKLVEVEWKGKREGRFKLSHDKETLPFHKQVYRYFDEEGKISQDLITLYSEEPPPASEHCIVKPLHEKVMERGEISIPSPPIDEIKERALENLKKLPAGFLRIRGSLPPPLKFSERILNFEKKGCP